ncbi:MAG: glycosyltransferase family 2 protein [Patescibacteria group bacterium]
MKHTNHLPTISIVTATYNSIRTIERCLQSIRTQHYPQQNIEIIVVDGGSIDATLTIAKKYNARIYTIDPKKQNAEYNKSIGIKNAKNELLAMIDHDNVLPHARWLSKIVRPFVENKNIVGVETLRYQYDKKEGLLDRYFALFGTGDPFVWYLGRSDRLSYMFDRYNLAGEIVFDGDYYIVRFSVDRIPTIGANGFIVRRETLMNNAQATPGKYFDMDVNVDLITKGFDTYAFVDDAILHLTGYGNIWSYLKRRMLFMNQYHLGEKSLERKRVRRYEIFTKKELWRLVLAIFYCVTLVVPFYDSCRGCLKIRDRAWFLHPLMGVGFVFIYSWVIIRHQIYYNANKILGK